MYIKVFRKKGNEPRREGPFRLILTTPAALRVEGKIVWYHLNHCSRAEEPGQR